MFVSNMPRLYKYFLVVMTNAADRAGVDSRKSCRRHVYMTDLKMNGSTA